MSCSWPKALSLFDDSRPQTLQHTHSHPYTHLHTVPTCPLARGCSDSGAVGPESYYLRGGLSSWQPLEFMKSQYLLFFSLWHGAAMTWISVAVEYIITFWLKETTDTALLLLSYAAGRCFSTKYTLYCVRKTWWPSYLYQHTCGFTFSFSFFTSQTITPFSHGLSLLSITWTVFIRNYCDCSSCFQVISCESWVAACTLHIHIYEWKHKKVWKCPFCPFVHDAAPARAVTIHFEDTILFCPQ